MSRERCPKEETKGKRPDFGLFGKICDKTDEYLKDAGFDEIGQPKFQVMRANAIKQLKKQISNDKQRDKLLLTRLWTSFYYPVLKIIRGSALSEECAIWVDMLISVLAGELIVIAKEFSEIRVLINVYIGDLKRYAWILFRKKKDLMLAKFHYRRAIIEDEDFGLALNQLGLLLQESNHLQALVYLLLASVVANKPFQASFKNIESLILRSTNEEDAAALSLVNSCLNSTSSDECQRHSSRWLDDIMLREIESKDAYNKALLLHILCLLTKHLIRKGNEASLRCVCDTLLKASLKCFMPAVEEWKINNFERFKRRVSRNSNSSTESDSDTNNVRLCPDGTTKKSISCKILLGALLHLTVLSAQYVYADRCPSMIRSLFEKVCEKLVDILNELDIKPKKSSKGLWFIIESSSDTAASHFAQILLETRWSPILYNGTFLFSSKHVAEKDLMKNMAKLCLDHEKKQMDALALLPVYVVPDEKVFSEKLHIIKEIVARTGLIVVVPEFVLRSLDKGKEDVRKRAAIRWTEVEKKRNRCKVQAGESIESCAQELAKSCDSSVPVVVAILTLSPTSRQISEAIIEENIEMFNKRCNVLPMQCSSSYI